MDWLRAGYGLAAMLDEDFARRLVLHGLGLQLRTLDELLCHRSEAAARRFASGLPRTVEQWRTMREAKP